MPTSDRAVVNESAMGTVESVKEVSNHQMANHKTRKIAVHNKARGIGMCVMGSSSLTPSLLESVFHFQYPYAVIAK